MLRSLAPLPAFAWNCSTTLQSAVSGHGRSFNGVFGIGGWRFGEIACCVFIHGNPPRGDRRDVGQFALQNVATGYCNGMTAAQPGEIAAEGNAHHVLTARDS